MTSIKVILCLVIVIAAFYNTDTKYYQQDILPKDQDAILSIFEATVVIYVGFAGFDILTQFSLESVDPSKDIPKSMIGSVFSTGLFYVVFAISLIGINITGVAQTSDPDTALAESFEKIGATWTA